MHIKMAGKSNRGRNRNGSQQSAMNSSEQAISSDAPLNGTSSAIQANGDTSLSESNDTNSEVKDQDNASHQHQTKQADIHLYPVSVKTQGGKKLELQLSPGDSVMDVRQFLLDAPETCFLTCYDLLLHANDGSVHHLENYNEISEVADISSGSCFLEMIPAMQIPVIDLAPYLEFSGKLRSPGKEELDSNLKDLCLEVSRTLRETGALLVKDPRCSAEDNDRFLDMMEKYFEMPDDFKRQQERSHLHYQVGVTPEGVEVPRSLVDEEMQETLRAMPIEFQPSTPTGPDPKWRYMWRVGPRPSCTRFKELNSEPVIPDGFPEWKDTMDSWGYKMISAIEAVAEMAAVGFGLQKDAFTSLMKQGPHLLAPTGSDLSRHGQIGTVFAGYHYDLNFLTIHGRSRFPGLNIWLRNGQKMEVKVPVGCLLIQTGKQIEWLTAGDCIAGMHEVVVTDRTIDAIKLASEQNHSLWRVSSTLFAHIASDAVLKPLGHFADSALACQYSPVCAGEFVEQELSVINLKGSKGDA